ncbi:hypothetical protein COV17_00515 [Candidatus Woesearchaeota archaeon CG10_big_fil_rev_8_21_14_0_10_36_11]|nr:MAG: hypothetical protein COV17_00515 [Candidatus Woesearchaeota archaeon CG10_big_fil_rev_8_21_14_0_10_36_11]
MEVKKGSKSSTSSTTFHAINKRGQITVFIIIGIIILFVTAGILFVTKMVIKEDVTAEGEYVREDVPLEFHPIQTYTENCLLQVATRGLNILGEQGGYIYPELVGDFSVTDPTNSVGINIQPARVPYWYYNKEENNDKLVTFASGKPPLYMEDDTELSVEAQLSRYVEEKIDDCLVQYEPFAWQGFRVEAGESRADVSVAPSAVQFLLTKRLSVKKDTAERTMERFSVSVPLQLQKYYEVAAAITDAQQNYSFLELQGINLIEMYAGASPEKLPPTYDVQFDFVGVQWTTPDVEQKFKSLLATHVPMLRFFGSDNMFDYVFPSSRLSDTFQSVYDNFIVPVEWDNPGVSVRFNYFNWPLYFHLTESGTVKPQELFFSNPLGFPPFMLAMQKYRTQYDTSYPILVTIEDEQALDGEGYTFNFALEANLRNNWAVEDGGTTVSLAGVAKPLICDENKRNTELVRLVVVDSYTFEPVDTVRIGLTIPEETECLIGVTDEQGTLETPYPLVTGGVLNFMKEEYLTNFYPIDTYNFQDEPGIIGYAIGQPENVIPLHKKVTVPVTVKKVPVQKCIDDTCFFAGSLFSPEPIITYRPETLDSDHSWVLTGAKKPLDETETATVFLERVRDTVPGVFNSAFQAAITITGEETQNVELVPGVYKVTGTVLLNDVVRIPEERRCIKVEVIPHVWEESECFTIDEISLNAFVSSQIEWNTESTYITLTPEQLYGSQGIILYLPVHEILDVPEEQHVRVMEDLNVMAELTNISRQPSIRRMLQPTLT